MQKQAFQFLRIFLKNLYLVLNPADQLGYSAVDAWLVGTPATLAPAYNPRQPPVPFCCLTYQGSATVSLKIYHLMIKKTKPIQTTTPAPHVDYLPDRSPPLHSRCQRTSFEELNTSHRHWSGRKQTEQLSLPELALNHLSQSLEEE